MDLDTETLQTSITEQDVILQAALKLFAKKGYFNTSLLDIKDAAGLQSLQVIHHHFKTKQSLASSLYVNVTESLRVSIDDIRRRTPKSSEQLRGIVDLLFTLTDDAPDVVRFILTVKINEFLPEEVAGLETTVQQKILKIIDEGIKTGEIRSIAPQLAFAYFFGVIDNTLKLVLSGALDKKAEIYQSQAWLTAWNTIVKK
ncbi:MAG: TetR/AcrR family transcriptional regulator [Methylococcales bacterium]|nr:TetR/AcrR family transcriptional regulator [Methylococcaceae bacterium]